MANKTPKLGLNIWLENDVVNVDEIDDNFTKLDGMNLCIESGTKTASYSGGTEGVATWRYKKYADGTIDMSAKLNFTNLKCNGGTTAPFYSGSPKVYFPFTFKEVYDVQMHQASNSMGWISNITGKSVLDYVMFRILALTKEDSELYKQVYINVKGVIG